MPVRKIPRNYLHMTGRVSMAGQPDSAAFEGGLERDFYTLLDFDASIADVDHQPVRIDYSRPGGLETHYTPDALVTYYPWANRRPQLCEVKTREDLKNDWSDLRPGFKAAVRYAKKQGWRFAIYTEVEIRTPFLANVRLLRDYRFIPIDEIKRARLVRPLRNAGEATLQTLIDDACPVIRERGPWLSQLWLMLATGELDADLRTSKLSYQTRVRLPQGA
jgi:hypothetical protein